MPKRIEIQGLEDFIQKCEKAGKGDFKKEIALWMEAMGFEFLDLLQDEIIRMGAVDTRLLLNSFEKGAKEGVWEITNGGLTIEVGTSLYYAQPVNDGHWLNPKGVSRRFVPGYWTGNHFVYDPKASGGMMLKQRFIEGYHYWESALNILERIFEASFEKKLQQWLTKYF